MGKKSLPTRTEALAEPSLPPPAICRWPLWLRVVVSIVVAFHVFAVFVGPWAALPDQASPLARDCRLIVGPYDDVLCLGNGYRFFAPEPGPSHLVKYKVTLKDGKTIEGKFPDRKDNRPRLLYHRYFMLSETLNSLYVPDDRPEDRVVFNLYVKSYARHLLHAYNGKEVQLTLIEHRIPAIEDYQKSKINLTAEQLYEELQLGTFREDEP